MKYNVLLFLLFIPTTMADIKASNKYNIMKIYNGNAHKKKTHTPIDIKDLDYIPLKSEENIIGTLFIVNLLFSSALFFTLMFFSNLHTVMIPLYFFYTSVMILINMITLWKLEFNFFLLHSLCFISTIALFIMHVFFDLPNTLLITLTFFLNLVQVIYINSKITEIRREYEKLNKTTYSTLI